MYIWQWGFSEDLVLIGRDWDSFRSMVDLLRLYSERRGFDRLVVYDHNLSYEFQFVKGIWSFSDPRDVFVMDSRKILRAIVGVCEFRCSFIHSNMSLDKFTTAVGCRRKKLVGALDYSKVRYPWTPLTDQELRYCIYDVVSLIEAIRIELRRDGDTLATIPLTSTGYVRREAKAVLRDSYTKLRTLQPGLDLFNVLRESFRGGDVHANRYYAGCIIEGVQGMDRSSSYPDCLVNHRFPMAPFTQRGPVSMVRMLININQHRRACILRIALRNVRLKNRYCGCPYITRDKSRNIIGGVADNGRILRAEYLETTITDLDYRIIADQYEWDPEDAGTGTCIFDSWWSSYDWLPQEFRRLVCDYYRKKTELKSGPEEETPDERDERLYMYGKAKNKINSLYGMCAQNILKPDLEYTDESGYYVKGEDPAARLARNARKGFLPYSVGVWVTAWARWELHRAIKIADDGGGFVYSDTDSVKYVGDLDLSDYNKSAMLRSLQSGAWADDQDGVRHYMGVYEPEYDGPLPAFVTWGAKKYAYLDPDGELHITISGVDKVKGAAELAEKGGIKALAPGFRIPGRRRDR